MKKYHWNAIFLENDNGIYPLIICYIANWRITLVHYVSHLKRGHLSWLRYFSLWKEVIVWKMSPRTSHLWWGYHFPKKEYALYHQPVSMYVNKQTPVSQRCQIWHDKFIYKSGYTNIIPEVYILHLNYAYSYVFHMYIWIIYNILANRKCWLLTHIICGEVVMGWWETTNMYICVYYHIFMVYTYIKPRGIYSHIIYI